MPKKNITISIEIGLYDKLKNKVPNMSATIEGLIDNYLATLKTAEDVEAAKGFEHDFIIQQHLETLQRHLLRAPKFATSWRFIVDMAVQGYKAQGLTEADIRQILSQAGVLEFWEGRATAASLGLSESNTITFAPEAAPEAQPQSAPQPSI